MFDIQIYDEYLIEISYVRVPPPKTLPVLPKSCNAGHYMCSFSLTLTTYKVTANQLVGNFFVQAIPKKIAKQVKEHGPHPCRVLRGPSGIEVPVNFLAPAHRTYARFGKGWKYFCFLHNLTVGDVLIFKFTKDASRMVDVKIIK